ncbi:MAG: DUF3618 domain-containing protein [Bradyrhizobiaceae bacterium]|nr:DUF3618 domain-containing protein [Bradyrhizobiaceae bacterium]
MLRSELLEREAEARRIELAKTFDELRARATPGHMLNQLVDYASDSGGADFFRNLRDQTVANPLALGLVGAGLAWLMMSRGREPARSYDPYYYDEMGPPRGRTRSYFAATREHAGDAMSGARHLMSDTAHGVRDRASDAAQLASDAAGSIASTARSARDVAFGTASSLGEQARERVGDTTAAVGNAASAVYGGVSNTASALYGGVSNTAGRTASGVRVLASGTAATGRDMFELARDQPLVLAGLGLAFGAAMGAAFPSTETERQLMGPTSDELKEQTHAFAAENYERSRSVAETVYDELQSRAHESGGEGSLPRAGQTGIVPLEEDIKGPMRPERIGLRDGKS